MPLISLETPRLRRLRLIATPMTMRLVERRLKHWPRQCPCGRWRPRRFFPTEAYNIELEWTHTERVSVVVDDRLPDRGELHIAFSAGYSSGGEHDIYYGYYNGLWTPPEKVEDIIPDSAEEDGIATTDVFLRFSSSASTRSVKCGCWHFRVPLGEGLGINGLSDVNGHAYFEGPVSRCEFRRRICSGRRIRLQLGLHPGKSPELKRFHRRCSVYVHVADNADGSGLGATGRRQTDGFLAGDWESVGARLADDDKYFEGRFNEDVNSDSEWGDDDDKIGLLIKLNVLGVRFLDEPSDHNEQHGQCSWHGARRAFGARGRGSDGIICRSWPFFQIGADIDIVDSNTEPSVEYSSPMEWEMRPTPRIRSSITPSAMWMTRLPAVT